ncbi:undecaprenyl diphosphate synthase [Candidatus Methanophagaceae archaeon]|nr:undecaprenyl diphosphate synthase [Methanophagales archaeon]
MNNVLLVLDETDLLPDEPVTDPAMTNGLQRLKQFITWCHALNIDIISVYISVIREGLDKKLLETAYAHLSESIAMALRKEDACIAIYTDAPEQAHTEIINYAKSSKGRRIDVSIGLGGKSELTKAIKEIAKRVMIGEIEPEEINEKEIESELIFKSEPDLIIRSGATRLTDFLIWQSVYSEFYFTDVNWMKFRQIDFFRAVRDFQLRERRFGR